MLNAGMDTANGKTRWRAGDAERVVDTVIGVYLAAV
jgi:hypothetical protein